MHISIQQFEREYFLRLQDVTVARIGEELTRDLYNLRKAENFQRDSRYNLLYRELMQTVANS